jgi:hypothetical protein
MKVGCERCGIAYPEVAYLIDGLCPICHDAICEETTDDFDDETGYDDYESCDYPEFIEPEWTDEDEAGLEEYEENKRRRIAEENEY